MAKSKMKVAKKTALKTAPKKVAKKATPKKAAKPAAKSPKKLAKKPAPKPAQKPTGKAPVKAAGKNSTAKKSPKKISAAKPKAAGKVSKKATPKANNVISMTHARAARTPTAKMDLVFTPLDDRVLIERAGRVDRTPGGIYIPDMVEDRPNRGKVVAVGRGHRDKKGRVRPLDVQKGDEVMYAPFSGSEITISQKEFLILREEEIIAVVKL